MAKKNATAGAGAAGAAGAEGEEQPKGKSKKLIVIGLGAVLLLGAGGGGAYFFTKPAAAAPPPVAGAVVALDPISLNLADSHYLKLGIALQDTDKAAAASDGSKALDLAIGEFSGVSMQELADPAKRQHYKDELQTKIVKAYTEDKVENVMGIYFTQFVMQ